MLKLEMFVIFWWTLCVRMAFPFVDANILWHLDTTQICGTTAQLCHLRETSNLSSR